MWKLYAIGFAVMAALMIIAGGALFIVTLASPAANGATPVSDWLIRAGVAVILGLFAAGLSTLAWRQSRRPAA
jgi:hypothetical protein